MALCLAQQDSPRLALPAPASLRMRLSDQTSPGGSGWAVSRLLGLAGHPPSAGFHPSCQYIPHFDYHLLCEDIPEFPSAELSPLISCRDSIGEGR